MLTGGFQHPKQTLVVRDQRAPERALWRPRQNAASGLSYRQRYRLLAADTNVSVGA